MTTQDLLDTTSIPITNLVPDVKITITDEMVEHAIPNSFGWCVMAIALRTLGYERVAVTADTIKACKQIDGHLVRYMWPTPKPLAMAAIEFDRTHGKAGFPIRKLRLAGTEGAMNFVQPRRDLRGHKGRGPTKNVRTPAKKICVRRWKGLRQFKEVTL
jgi:hypothetical protein